MVANILGVLFYIFFVLRDFTSLLGIHSHPLQSRTVKGIMQGVPPRHEQWCKIYVVKTLSPYCQGDDVNQDKGYRYAKEEGKPRQTVLAGRNRLSDHVLLKAISALIGMLFVSGETRT
jgi:hypothetical protein